jgi:uncharacterized integral membrane protein
MIRKVVSAVILAPLAILIVLFAVANREPITISFDPFNPVAPAFTMQVPLFIVVLVLLLIGVVVGGVAAWLRQSRARRIARRLEAEVRALRAELDSLGRRPGRSNLPVPLDVTPPLIARSPAA